MDFRDGIQESYRNSEVSSNCEPRARSHDGTRRELRRLDEAIVAWRVWGVSTPHPTSARPAAAKTLTLVSTFMDSEWRPGLVMMACCSANMLRHGIHAFASAADAITYMSQGRKPIRHVYGEVSLWGRIMVHERGYRAQCAYPRRIFVPKTYRGSRDIVNELRRAYGVEAEWTT